MNFYDKIFKPKKIILKNGKVVYEFRSKIPIIMVLLFFATIISIKVTGFRLITIIERGNQFSVIIGKMFSPKGDYLKYIWDPLFETIKMSFLGSVLGALLAIPFSVISASNIIKKRSVIIVTRLIFSVIRTLPTLVTALIATYMFGLGTFAGTISISIFTFAYVGKQLYEQIETSDMGSFEAVESMGGSKIVAFIVAVIPQVVPTYLSVCLFCFEGNVRYASILGYVGAGGLGLILNEKIGWRDYSSVGTILITLFFTVLIIEVISHYLRKKLI